MARTNGEGTIYENKTRKRFEGQILVDGKRHKVTGKSRRIVADKIGKLQHGTAAHREADRTITVGQILTEWRDKAVPNRNLSPGSIEIHDWSISRWQPVIGSRKVADLRPTDIENALAKLNKAKPMARSSMVKLRSTLNQAMTWAVKRGVVARNPVDGVELPRSKRTVRERQALTVAQLDDLRAELVGHPMEALLLLSAGAGLRPGEAAAVTVEAVDLDAGIVKVVQSVRKERGRPYLSDQLKTTKSRRAVELRSMVVEALHRHLASTGIKSGLLFTAPDGGPVWDSTVRSELKAACLAAEVPVISPNELRHTFTTHAVDGGLPPHVVADILGHTNTRMVEQYYRHRPLIITGARFMDDPAEPGALRTGLRAVS